MVQLKDLANRKGNREVREVIFVKDETITVYEPDKDNIEEIFALQERFIDGENPERLQLTGRDVVGLFSMLTDIKGLNDLSDDEIEDIVNNPSMALIQVQKVIEGIVIEVYKMVILSIQNEVLLADIKMETAKSQSELLERTKVLAQRDGKTKKYADNIDKAKAKVLQLQKLEQEQEVVEEVAEETAVVEKPNNVKQIGKHANVLAQYQNTFGEVEDE